MFICKLYRYHSSSGTTEMEIQIPQRVTITGSEDHFHRAYEDAQMAIAGMREMDRAATEKGKPDDKHVIIKYGILSLVSI